MNSLYEIFGEPIHVYTRRQALEEGGLVDVVEVGREAGITFPVAITAALHADVSNIPEEHSYQTYRARLFDLLFMFTAAVRGVIPKVGDDQYMTYKFIMHVGDSEDYTVKAVCGPGDDAEPVITLMQEFES